MGAEPRAACSAVPLSARGPRACSGGRTARSRSPSRGRPCGALQGAERASMRASDENVRKWSMRRNRPTSSTKCHPLRCLTRRAGPIRPKHECRLTVHVREVHLVVVLVLHLLHQHEGGVRDDDERAGHDGRLEPQLLGLCTMSKMTNAHKGRRSLSSRRCAESAADDDRGPLAMHAR